MDSSFLKEFVERYNKDKEEFNRKFEDINRKLAGIDGKFDSFDEKMGEIRKKLEDAEDIQKFMFGRLDNVKVYLSTIETKLNEYKTLNLQGEKVLNGELFTLKIKLQKIKPIISWENDELLASKYKEIESNVLRLEESFDKMA